MGIHGFTNFFSSCYKEKELNSYLGTSIIVDGKYQLIRYGIAIRDTGEDMFNMNGDIINHLHATITFTLLMLRLGIKPIYIFDGKSPDLKKETIESRNIVKTRAQSKLSILEDKNSREFIKNFKRSYTVNNSQLDECLDLLEYIGVTHLKAKGEADPYCASLSNNNDIYGVISNDSDLLVFGAKTLLKDFTGKGKVKEISLNDIYDFMKYRANEVKLNAGIDLISKVSHENFIDFCILLGCDYTQHIKGFTGEQLFEFFALNNFNINNTIQNMYNYIATINNGQNEYYIPDDFLIKAQEAKEYYLQNRNINVNINKDILLKPNGEKLHTLLHKKNFMDEDFVDKFIGELEQLYYAMHCFNKKNDSGFNFSCFNAYRWNYYKKKHLIKNKNKNNNNKYSNNSNNNNNNNNKYSNNKNKNISTSNIINSINNNNHNCKPVKVIPKNNFCNNKYSLSNHRNVNTKKKLQTTNRFASLCMVDV